MISKIFPAMLSELGAVMTWVRSIDVFIPVLSVDLVIEEVVTNIIMYSSSKDLEISCCKDRRKFIITDSGVPFNMLEYPAYNVKDKRKKAGGLGIALVRKYTSEIKYLRKDNQNILTLMFSV